MSTGIEIQYVMAGLALVVLLISVALAIWWLTRTIGLMDDIRYLSDVARAQNPQVPYRNTSGIVIVGMIILPAVIAVLAIISLLMPAAEAFFV